MVVMVSGGNALSRHISPGGAKEALRREFRDLKVMGL